MLIIMEEVFSGSIAMLDHGYGSMILAIGLSGINLVLPVILLALIGLNIFLLFFKSGKFYIFYIWFLSVTLGMYGYSTLSISAIPLIIVFLIFLKRDF